MEKEGHFADFDDRQTYKDSQERALHESTRNFVVHFGAEGADIAFDVHADDVSDLLKTQPATDRPVRWMWVVNLLVQLRGSQVPSAVTSGHHISSETLSSSLGNITASPRDYWPLFVLCRQNRAQKANLLDGSGRSYIEKMISKSRPRE